MTWLPFYFPLGSLSLPLTSHSKLPAPADRQSINLIHKPLLIHLPSIALSPVSANISIVSMLEHGCPFRLRCAKGNTSSDLPGGICK